MTRAKDYKEAVKLALKDMEYLMEEAWEKGHIDSWDSMREEKKVIESIEWLAENPEAREQIRQRLNPEKSLESFTGD